jgi:Domain of unknown function (DUF4386)
MNTINHDIRTARLAGLLYLLIFFAAGFAEGVVRTGAREAAEVTSYIAANSTLYRLGFTADLTAFISDAVIAVILYRLLKPAGAALALTAAVLRLLAHPAIAAVNLLNHFLPLLLLSGGTAAFNPAQTEALAATALELHRQGYLLAGAFFGPHLILLGLLLIRSVRFPRWLGVLLVLAGAGYLVESFGNFIVPAQRAVWTWFVAVPAVAGEMALALWLVIRGVRRDPAAISV